jgi:hypothetical protein
MRQRWRGSSSSATHGRRLRCQVLCDGDQEGQRLARACLGLGQHVIALLQEWRGAHESTRVCVRACVCACGRSARQRLAARCGCAAATACARRGRRERHAHLQRWRAGGGLHLEHLCVAKHVL